MSEIYFISHPEAEIDKGIQITQWDLSDKGKERLKKLLGQPWISSLSTIWSSNEVKAKTAARAIANKLNKVVDYKEELGEMDRSSTGFLEPREFNVVVDEFFAHPEKSTRGWETALDAQNRIVKAVQEIVDSSPEGNIAIVAHGGVGGLLLSHLKRTPISRSEDQPGQGHYFMFTRKDWILEQGWLPIDEITHN